MNQVRTEVLEPGFEGFFITGLPGLLLFLHCGHYWVQYKILCAYLGTCSLENPGFNHFSLPLQLLETTESSTQCQLLLKMGKCINGKSIAKDQRRDSRPWASLSSKTVSLNVGAALLALMHFNRFLKSLLQLF